jgi:alkylhydroperoxidase family enzyme
MRIEPVAQPYSEPVAQAFDRVMPKGVPPLSLFRTLAVNERVFLRVMAGGLLDRGPISLRDREIVIDRTCWRCGCEYEWGVHVAFFGPKAQLTANEIHAVTSESADAFPPRDRLLIAMCDELHATSSITDALWAQLAAEWSPAQLVELVVLAGFYHLIAFAANAFRLAPEPFAARFP